MSGARVLVCLLALASSGCADSDATEGGEGGEDGGIVDPVPDHDAELRCAAAVAPELAVVGPILGGVVLGPCGHLAYHDDQDQGYLIEPDGVRGELDFASHVLEFAPTGDLLAWEHDLDGGLRLRDLVAGIERVIHEEGSIHRFAFVPSFADPTRGAWLWTCELGMLERHDITGSELVAESVVCGSVVGSSGSPRLGFADLESRVWLVDLDTGALVGSEGQEFAGHDGGKRDDTLWVDHDGELIVHVAIEWQGDDDIDSEWPVELWSRVLDRHGESVLEATTGLAPRQTPRRGAPVFMLYQDELVRFDAGAPSSVDVAIASAELSESGELFSITPSDEVLVVESSVGEPLTSIGEFVTPVELQPSPGGNNLALEHQSEICIVDEQGDCNRILMALRAWSRESGLAPTELLSSSPWNLEATLDDGSMLVVGSPVQADGPTYMGEQPPARVLLLDRDGAIQAELPADNGDLAIRQTFTLADDRVLFEYRYGSGIGELMVAETGQPFVTLVVGAGVALLQSWVDARAQRVAFVGQAGGNLLWYGAL
jgi:hypothetical protein